MLNDLNGYLPRQRVGELNPILPAHVLDRLLCPLKIARVRPQNRLVKRLGDLSLHHQELNKEAPFYKVLLNKEAPFYKVYKVRLTP